MAILGFEVEEIARLLALMEAQQWDDFIIEEEGRYLRIRGPRRNGVASSAAPVLASNAPKALPAAPPETRAVLPSNQTALPAPMMGVFYRAESPGAPPLVQVGERIAVGQTIGIIEAMKIFSEIPAEQAGVVVAILAQDRQMVHAGTPLMIVQTGA